MCQDLAEYNGAAAWHPLPEPIGLRARGGFATVCKTVILRFESGRRLTTSPLPEPTQHIDRNPACLTSVGRVWQNTPVDVPGVWQDCPDRGRVIPVPSRPPHPCAYPGCPQLVTPPVRRCPPHLSTQHRSQDARRESSTARGYKTAAWKKLRQLVLARDPMCRHCGRASSSDVDHRLPKELGGIDSMENLQGLCHSCHSRKTMQEAVAPRR